MSKIISKVAKNTESYQQNFAYHSALQNELRERIARAATGDRDHLLYSNGTLFQHSAGFCINIESLQQFP